MSHVQYKFNCRGETHTVLLRLDQPGQGDVVKDANRAELARLYPAGSKEFKQIYGWRNRSESTHARLKTTMKRLSAYGKNKQTLFVLATQLLWNSESQYQWRITQAKKAGAAKSP